MAHLQHYQQVVQYQQQLQQLWGLRRAMAIG